MTGKRRRETKKDREERNLLWRKRNPSDTTSPESFLQAKRSSKSYLWAHSWDSPIFRKSLHFSGLTCPLMK
jgi:hypothetical protein